MVEHFYFVMSNEGAVQWKVGPIDDMMLSASHFWDSKKAKFRRRKIPEHTNFFLDSGGFTLLARWHDYPFTVEQYVELIKNMTPTYAAVMDYPCEPELRVAKGPLYTRIHDLSVRERIKATLENSRMLMDHHSYPFKPTELLPVIQGWKIDDYLECLRSMSREGLITPYMAVGSCCRRGSVQDLKRLIISIRQTVNKIDKDIRLHFFGVKINVLKDAAVWDAVYSCDTAAWTHNVGTKNIPGVLKVVYPRNQKEKLENYLAYREKVDKLQLRWNRRRSLKDLGF